MAEKFDFEAAIKKAATRAALSMVGMGLIECPPLFLLATALDAHR